MSGKKDYLGQCMDSVDVDSSIDEFKQAFCSRCYREECAHSQWGRPGWLGRMRRQMKALEDPTRLDPNRPDVKPIAQQDFEDSRNLEKDAWSMPADDGPPAEPDMLVGPDGGELEADPREYDRNTERSDGAKEVHKAEPPTKSQSSDKVDRSAEALGGDGVSSESDSAPEEDSGESIPRDESDEDRSSVANTDVPDEGIMLDPEGRKESDGRRDGTGEPDESKSGPGGDWTHPDHGSDGGGLTVNIEDGTKIDE